MGKASRKKKEHSRVKPQKEQSTREKLKANWFNKYPILVFVLGFGLLMGVFYGFWFTELFKENILNPVISANVWLSGTLLKLVGYQISMDGANLYSGEFSVNVAQGCDALEPMAIYLFIVLLFPIKYKAKLPAVLIGLPLLFLLNQVRIISLFFMGIYAPALFDFTHIVVWQVLFIIVALLMIAYWLYWANKKYNLLPPEKPVEHATV